MLQATTEERAREALEQVLEHLQSKGWEINPSKIQDPAQVVEFLGIMWNPGRQEILPKAKSKILKFATPKTKKEAQKFIDLFGFLEASYNHT